VDNGSGYSDATGVPYPTTTPRNAYASDDGTQQRHRRTPSNAVLGQLGCLGYSKSHRTVNPVIVPARYNFPYSSSRPACGRPPPAAVLAPAATRRSPRNRPRRGAPG
jgi:hypothetical protein